ncbi:MAG TPA: rRNA maturation RNase YbeY, partial [Dehalococcoidia bacterium]|nr:rRNA maturation RNase YbeY [Dehalococcoidia bacterium]
TLARMVLEAQGTEQAIELSIAVADDETVRDLNARYLGEDAPTDVLSFPLWEGEPFPQLPGVARPLGEVIISYPTARRQAQGQGHSVERELAHLLVHGILHLLGYDHAEPGEERAMRAREEEILAGLEGSPSRA